MELTVLMKMAETNKETAWSAYNKKFGTTPVRFHDAFYYAKTKDGYRINSNNKTICIENYEYLTKFLRNFGHLVNDFHIEHNERSTFQITDVFNLIASHCTAIKKLHLHNNIEDDDIELMVGSSSRVQEMSRNALHINTVLPTLESLDIEKVYFEAGMKLDVCFPNLSSMDLMTISASEPSMFEVNFPKLEHLGIMMTDDEENDDDDDYDCQLNRINVENILKLNSQLKSIWLEMKMDMPLLKFINETLLNLQKVDFLIWIDDFDGYHGGDVVFKGVTKANLGRLGKEQTPLIFENLKEMTASPLANQSTIDFIKKHRLLTTLDLTCDYRYEQIIQLVGALRDLQELNIIVEKEKWSIEQTIRLLAECERLNRVHIMVNIDSSKQRNWYSKIAPILTIKNEYSDDFYVIEKSVSSE